MGMKLYTMIFKVRCESCMRKIDKECNQCYVVKRRNVNNLLRFHSYIDKDFPNWIWWNVYEKTTRNKVETFTNGRDPHHPRNSTLGG